MLTQEEKSLLVEVAKSKGGIKMTNLLEVGVTMCLNGVIYIGTGQEKV